MKRFFFVMSISLVVTLRTTLESWAISTGSDQLYWQELVPGGANHGDSADEMLKHAALNGGPIQTILTTNANDLGSVSGLSYVPTLQKLYWGSGPYIFRANLDGSDFEHVVFIPTPGNNSDIRGLAFDLANSKMYWADQRQKNIIGSDLNGNNRTTLSTGLEGGDLALDLTTSQFFVTVAGRGPNQEGPYDSISRLNLNGTGQQTIISGIVQLTSIQVDPIAGKVYWVDVGYNAFNDTTIRRANLDGSGVETVLANMPDVIVDFDVDYINKSIYWTSRDEGLIKKSDLNGGHILTIFSGLSEPQAIVLVPEPDSIWLLLVCTFAAIPRCSRSRRYSK